MLAFLVGAQRMYERAIQPHLPSDQNDPVTTAVSALIRAAAVLLATWVVVRAGRQSFEDAGLPPRKMLGRNFWTGAAWGVVNVSVVMGILFLFGSFRVAGFALNGAAIAKFGLLWGIACFFIALFEESAFRGYLLFGLVRGMGFWPASILLSLLFAFLHRRNPGETFIGLVGVFVITMFICITVLKTGSLWFAIGFHMAFDWCESFLYSVPDSGVPAVGHLLNSQLNGSRWLTGGTAGPEGSVIMLTIDVLFIPAFWLTHRESHLVFSQRTANALPSRKLAD
jgi:membrane protease YdiL (CAAX protease family)